MDSDQSKEIVDAFAWVWLAEQIHDCFVEVLAVDVPYVIHCAAQIVESSQRQRRQGDNKATESEEIILLMARQALPAVKGKDIHDATCAQAYSILTSD